MFFDCLLLGGGIFLGVQFGAFFEKQWGYLTAIVAWVKGLLPKAPAAAVKPAVVPEVKK